MLLQANPTCQLPDHGVNIIKAVAPDYPDSAYDLRLGDILILVDVNVDETGKVQKAWITQSSNNMALDHAALTAARTSTYETATHNCTPVPGVYHFRAFMHHS
jgi:TonB family protein